MNFARNYVRVEIILISLVSILLVFNVVSGARGQAKLPKLELVVENIDGVNASFRADTEQTWHSLKQDQTLNRGDHVRTGDRTTVTLQVPGISYMKVTPETEMQLEQLNRSTEDRGLLTTEEVTVNEIDIETEEGKVQNNVRKHEGVATEYDLKTPNAVAGIRGTSFQCEVTDFGRTECGVGEGEVRFASRANPEQSVTLQPGQKSSIGPEEIQPSEPEQLSEGESEELQQVQEESEQALLLPPVIEDIQLNGTSFQDSIRIEYSEQTELTLSGNASAEQEGATLENVTVTVNGEPATVEGRREWSVTQSPEAPDQGEEGSANIEISTTDSNGKTTSRTVRVTLVNPEETGQAPQTIPPEDYDEGNVPIEVTMVAGQPIDNIEFPGHAYQGDATSQGLMIEGTASGNATIEGVGYSLDGGNTWELTTGTENWSLALPAQSSGEYSVQVVAWTVDGVIGDPVEIGPIQYHAMDYTRGIRTVFREQWDAFSQENLEGFLSHVSSNFLFEKGDGEQLQGGEFENFLNNFFQRTTNLRVRYNIQNVQGGPGGGEVEAELEWRGVNPRTALAGGEIRAPFIAFGDGSFKYERQANGTFKMLSFEEFRPRFLRYRSNLSIDAADSDGVDGIVLTKVDGTTGDPVTFQITSTDILQFDFAPHEGGVTRLNTSQFQSVTRIPRRASGEYQNSLDLSADNVGQMYAINTVDFAGGPQLTIVMKLVDKSGSVYTFNLMSLFRPNNEKESRAINFPEVNPFR